MESNMIIILAGIIIAMIWLIVCIVIEEKNRKYIIMTGIMIDVVLFMICRNCKLFLIGVAGGLLCGLVPNFGSLWKYEIAVREMKGVKNWVVVSIILFVMIFMAIGIAYPDLKIVFG